MDITIEYEVIEGKERDLIRWAIKLYDNTLDYSTILDIDDPIIVKKDSEFANLIKLSLSSLIKRTLTNNELNYIHHVLPLLPEWLSPYQKTKK